MAELSTPKLDTGGVIPGRLSSKGQQLSSNTRTSTHQKKPADDKVCRCGKIHSHRSTSVPNPVIITPCISEVEPNLFISNYAAAEQTEILEKHRITAVITLKRPSDYKKLRARPGFARPNYWRQTPLDRDPRQRFIGHALLSRPDLRLHRQDDGNASGSMERQKKHWPCLQQGCLWCSSSLSHRRFSILDCHHCVHDAETSLRPISCPGISQ